TGLIHSKFTVEGESVEVWTAAAQSADKIAVKVSSPLIQAKRVQVFVRYPYPSGQFLDEAAYYEREDQHESKIVAQADETAVLEHTLSGTHYFTGLNYSKGKLEEAGKHYFVYQPASDVEIFEFSFTFAEENNFERGTADYAKAAQESQ